MNASTAHLSRRRTESGSKKVQSAMPVCAFESLEGRRLLSGTWSTIDTYQLSPGKGSPPNAMTSDSAGNVYVAGRAGTASGSYDGVIREKAAGSNTWTTIEDTGATVAINFVALAVDARGDVFAAGAPQTGEVWQVFERPAGQAAFSVIDRIASSTCRGLGTDSAGDVYAVGVSSSYSQSYWIVREMTAGTGSFRTIDNFSGATARAVSVVSGGTGAGIYVVGTTPTPHATYSGESNWLVRRSTDGGHTWTTVDNYNPKGYGDYPTAVTGDLNGNIFVAGYESLITGHWIVRQSATGASGSWMVTDSFNLGGTSRSLAQAMGVDASGNVYVAGLAADPANGLAKYDHSIIRSNIGGVWTTVDDLQTGSSAGYTGFAVDTSGNLYVAGDQNINNVPTWIVRSSPGPTVAGAGASATTTAVELSSSAQVGVSSIDVSTVFSSTLIATSTTVTSADSLSWLKTTNDWRLP